MNKEEVVKLFDELGHSKIDELYYYSCLIASGFDKDTAYENIYLLDGLFRKDENNTSISNISDMLYNAWGKADFDEMSTREILSFIYRYEYGIFEEDDEDIEDED